MSASALFRYVESAWKRQQRHAEKHRDRLYATEIEDPYRKPAFPMWVGIFLKPHRTPAHPVPLAKLQEEEQILRHGIRTFYTGKALDLLGNIYIYDPLLGTANLITTLRISIYHDQLHFDDVIKMAKMLRN